MKGREREASIAATRLRAETSPNRSSLDQPLLAQLVDVGDVLDQPLFEEAQRLLLPQPVDVHRPLADEVLDVLEGLAGAAGAVGQIVKTAPSGFTVGGPAGRAFLRRLRFARPPFAALAVSGATTCGITSPARITTTSSPTAHVLARQVLLVVEGRGADGDAADVDRLQHRERDQVPGAADVPDHVEQLRRRRRRRELPGDRPARLAPDHAQLPPQRPLVDLDDDAVDLVVELLAALLPPAAALDHGLDPRVVGGVGVDLEAALGSHSTSSVWVAGSRPRAAPSP